MVTVQDRQIDAALSVARAPWGKTDTATGESHHLAHHCADVAACFEAMLALPVIHARMAKAAGIDLSPTVKARLAVLAFLHDAGKLHPGFQAKGWQDGDGLVPRRGHLSEAAALFGCEAAEALARNLCLADLIDWGLDTHLLYASIAHHGRPFRTDPNARFGWRLGRNVNIPYDPVGASVEIGDRMRHWFPAAFTTGEAALPTTADFQHLFCGFVSLADWLGSDRRIFPFQAALDPDYMARARALAQGAVVRIGFDVGAIRPAIAGRTGFTAVTGFATPNAQQDLVGSYPLDEQLVILEAETGSGKTEAALWRFVRLFEAGLVDGLYFALPTRAAAVQLHGRIDAMLRRLFGAQAPQAVLAVPGYLKAGQTEGERLPGWQVRWDDPADADEDVLLARWAAEHAKRYLAACVAVGTVDQVMLAALQVKHAHLRGAALSRSLLVIDEVHASDSYMTQVQKHLLRLHLGRGGHAMLMSATLGSVARAAWLGQPPPEFDRAVATPYPAVWGRRADGPLHTPNGERQKDVAMALVPTMAAETAAGIAIDAAQRGARVLVVRNTVTAAIATWDAAIAAGAENLLLQVRGGPALHHGRFAPEDRKLLDAAVEQALLPRARPDGGVIVIGTQTLEQSLDIDADMLLTDLCPVDVLLQRIGRLHRHDLRRPQGFAVPACHVMTPENGLAPLLAPAFTNGLGAWLQDQVYQGIYRDLSILELTQRLVRDRPLWRIPMMNRALVEGATHEAAVADLHAELGPEWSRYRDQIFGKDVAERQAANNVRLPVEQVFADLQFPSDEERIRTRLGGEGARIAFTHQIESPFGQMIDGITLPAHWSRGLDSRDAVVAMAVAGGVCFTVGRNCFEYERKGLVR